MSLSKLKLEAIAKGQHPADCSFLVGPEEATAQIVHACTTELKLASEMFTAMFKSEWTNKPHGSAIRIKDIQPHIFKMLVEFTHVYEVCSIYTCQDLVDLAVAADLLLINPLIEHCASIIEAFADVDNVWSILNAAHHIPIVTSACSMLLSKETIECIDTPSFLNVSKNGIVPFLKMDNLNVASEMTLVNACLKVAASLQEVEALSFMRAAIPHLRIFQLRLKQIQLLAIYLNDDEKLAIAKTFIFKEKWPQLESLDYSAKLRKANAEDVSNTSKAVKELSLDIIPETMIPTIESFAFLSNGVFDADDEEYYGLHFQTQQSIILKGAEILTRVNQYPKYKYNDLSNCFVADAGEYEEKISLIVSYKVKSDDSYWTLHEEKIEGMKPYNSSIKVRFDEEVFVPQGVFCRIKVTVVNKSDDVPAYSILMDHATFLKNLEVVENISAVSEIKLDRFSRPDDKTKWARTEDNDFFCVIKNILFSAVK